MYLLLFLQFSSSTFYDPARRALEPTIIHRKQLHLGTTMDTFAWSVTVAIGSSLGGAVVSKLGTTMCFVLDSLTYIVASACVILLQVLPGIVQSVLCCFHFWHIACHAAVAACLPTSHANLLQLQLSHASSCHAVRLAVHGVGSRSNNMSKPCAVRADSFEA